jgi:hypothetical protein
MEQASVKAAGRPAVVLLGASNLTRCISTVLDAARARVGGPCDFYVAFGNGRSYGLRSTLLWRDLPGIRQCGLWPALAERRRQGTLGPVYALVTDIGNDVIYRAPIPDIEAWLGFCLGELRALDARIIVAQIPLARLRRITPGQVAFVRYAFAGGREMAWQSMIADAELLHERLAGLAREYGATLVEQPEAWYGFDPIHYPIKNWRTAWPTLLTPWGEPRPGHEPLRARPRQWLYLRRRIPEQRWVFGREQGRPQPCGQLPDGSTISLY